MPKNQQRENIRRAALVAEARAGLTPASDHIEAERHARLDRISRVVKAYAKSVASKPGNWDGLAITDVLTDLRHYCDSNGLLFDKLDSAAYEYYLQTAGESDKGIFITG